MRQKLLEIPLHEWIGTLHPWLGWLPDIPLYGYGMMLFFAFIFCQWLARRLCKREGIDGDLMLDLTIWLFIFGIVGGRVLDVVMEWPSYRTPSWQSTLYKMVALWNGGLWLYGALFGAMFGYFAYHHFVLKKHGVSHWKMLDVIAPCVALGIALGRIGCLFTGCCYGNVACADCPAVHFPLLSEPTMEMVKRGYQTPLGFSFDRQSDRVQAVEPGTAAAAAGLHPGDLITGVNGYPLEEMWHHAGGVLEMTVRRDSDDMTLAFEPRSIGLNPTQIYETISMGLLLFFMLSYYPYKRRDGELMVILMLGYGVHRFLNEMLRTDTEKIWLHLTLSQTISVAVLACGVVLAYLVYRRPPIRARMTEPEA